MHRRGPRGDVHEEDQFKIDLGQLRLSGSGCGPCAERDKHAGKDAGQAFARHRVFVAPLLSGAGIKGKVISALSHGIPCVISPIAAEGIGLRSGYDCIVAEKTGEWVEAIELLSNDDQLWEEMSQNARAYMNRAYSFDRGLQMMRAAFEAADLYGASR